jgi:predicted ATPase
MPRLHLRSFEIRSAENRTGFPFSVPAVRTLPKIELTSAVTFFVGANGSGKSTLLEAIAAAARLPAIGTEELERDATLADQRQLAAALRLTWSRRPFHGFFLRAEDYFGFARRVADMRAQLHGRVAQVDTDMSDASAYARRLAAGPARASLAALERLYGPDMDARSHGEAFLTIFEARLGNGIYLLDEPEAALSPQNQLGFMAMVAAAVEDGAQFIIATHSPILLAFPDALLLSFDSTPLERVEYAALEHVALTRDFLNDPDRYLRHLMQPEQTDT